MISVFIIGTISDVIAKFGYSMIFVNNYDTVSLTVIQIQAALFSLTIALLALMSGHITNAYLGMSFNDFLLNCKPIYFKQKRVIICSLVILIFSLFFHMFELYNLVVCNSIIICMLIGISAMEIYEAFTGTEQIESEIRAYLKDRIYCEDSEVISEYLKKFCYQWKKTCVFQSNGEYEEYKQIFIIIFNKCFENKNLRKTLFDQCVDLITVLFSEEKQYLRGITLLQECYEDVWYYIYSNDQKVKEEINNFCLFSEVYIDMQNALLKTDIKSVENIMDWDKFSRNIVLVDLWLGYDEKNKDVIEELRKVKNFGYLVGRYISNKLERDDELWANPLTKSCNQSIYPSSFKKIAEEVIENRNFNFNAALIKYDNTNLIEKYLYLGGLESIYLCDNEAYIIMVLKTHCYLYYLAYYETTSYVEQKLKEKCKGIIEKKEVKQKFLSFILYITSQDRNVFGFIQRKYDIFNEKLLDILINELRFYEEISKPYGVKNCVMQHVVQDFVIFIVMFVANHYNRETLIDKVITKDRATHFYHYYVCNSNKKHEFKQFLIMMGINDKELENKLEATYTLLEKRIRELCKNCALSNSCQQNKKADIDQQLAKEKLADNIKEYLEKQFKVIINQNDLKAERIHLCQMEICSNKEIENILDGEYEWIFNCFVSLLAETLKKQNKLNIIKKLNFQDDEEYFKYLKSKQNDVIIGSEFKLRPIDYSKTSYLRKIIEEIEHCTNGANGVALILKKELLKINITKVRVGIHKETIGESSAIYDKKEKNISIVCFLICLYILQKMNLKCI